jgi:hypothetical protein
MFERRPMVVKDTKRFLNLEPFLPLCKLANRFINEDPPWGTLPDNLLYKASFCTLFRPTFTGRILNYINYFIILA